MDHIDYCSEEAGHCRMSLRSFILSQTSAEYQKPSMTAEPSNFRLSSGRDVHECSPYAGFTITFNPSRGFGIGHICQSAL